MTNLYKLAHQLMNLYYFLVRPVTVGVKILLIRNGTVLLLQHTYKGGWYFPGGGVKRGETLVQAARREAAEEVGAALEEPQLLGIYSNLSGHKSDHVAVFFCNSFSLTGKTDYEIKRFEFFPIDELPLDVADGVTRRLEDYKRGVVSRFDQW